MEKKFYETPELEVLDMAVEGFFCASQEFGPDTEDGGYDL